MDRGNIFSGGSFRATLYGAVMFVIVLAICAVLAIRFIETQLRSDVRAQLSSAIGALKVTHQNSGQDSFVESMQKVSDGFVHSDRLASLYDSHGKRLAGKHDVTPDFDGWATRAVDELDAQGRVREFYVTAVPFGDMTVVIGRDEGFIRNIEWITLQSFLAVGALMTLVLIFIGYQMSRQVQSKLDSIGETLQQVSRGDTDARLEISAENDQIDRIARIMNMHLETLSDLMQSTKSSAVSIAHDLKRPLSRAYLGLEAALADTKLSDQSRACIEDTRGELAGLTATFETILRIARIDAAQGQALDGTVDLGELGADLGETYEVVAEESGQTLVLEIETDLALIVPGDRGMVGQLIVNLLQNAITHCPPGTFITLGIKATQNQVLVTVADTGPGIPESELSRVFEPFYRIDVARTSDGSGLGMALVKSIADRHQATISLNDNKPGLRVVVGFRK